MAITTFKQGEDAKVVIEVLKDGSPLDISSNATEPANGIKLILIDESGSEHCFTLNTESGCDGVIQPISTDVGEEHKIIIYLDRADTAILPVGYIDAVAIISLTNADYIPDGSRVEEYFFKNVAKVIAGQKPTETVTTV